MGHRALNLKNRHLRAALRAEPVGAGKKVRLEDRLDYQLAGHLGHTIANHGDSEWAFLRFARLVYPNSFDWFRTVATAFEFLAYIIKELADAILPFDPIEVLLVDSGCTVVWP